MIVSGIDCGFYRFVGFLLICISLMSIIITVRYFIHRYHRQQQRLSVTNLSSVLIGMLVSSTVCIMTAVPFTIIQCFTCQSFQSHVFICKMNGFICFFTGTFNMYILAHLSLCRYLNILHKHSLLNNFLDHNRSLSVLVCALIALCWTLPPLFNIGNTYISEGLGFHCGLDWNNSAFHSRLFILSLLICSVVLRKNQSVPHSERPLSRLQLLKIDQHYARITAIMVTQFIIAWTPYAFVTILTFDGRNEFIRQKKILSSICALFAKISIYTNKIRPPT